MGGEGYLASRRFMLMGFNRLLILGTVGKSHFEGSFGRDTHIALWVFYSIAELDGQCFSLN
jgi:hypothetical protein